MCGAGVLVGGKAQRPLNRLGRGYRLSREMTDALTITDTYRERLCAR